MKKTALCLDCIVLFCFLYRLLFHVHSLIERHRIFCGCYADLAVVVDKMKSRAAAERTDLLRNLPEYCGIRSAEIHNADVA